MLSRRGLFGIFAGAAIAGPAIAESATRRYASGGIAEFPGDYPRLFGEVPSERFFISGDMISAGTIRAQELNPAIWQITLNADGSIGGLCQVMDGLDTQGCA